MLHAFSAAPARPSRRSARGPLRSALCFLSAVAVAAVPAAPVQAQSRSMSFIRDAEIEALLTDYASPILRVAGLGGSNIGVHIVNSTSFNAFVMDGRRIFINAGVIMQAETPNEVIGVLAHETGHIAGGHLARLRQEMRGATALAILATVLGAGAIAAGGGASGAQAGQAMIMGGQHMAMRSLLAYQRGEEAAADRAAINYLEATGQSGQGMLATFQRLADQSMFSGRNADPYARSHPMPRDRVSALENVVRQSPHFDKKDPPALQARHEMAKAKLAGFLNHPSSLERTYPRADNSLPAQYARTIATMRTGSFRDSLKRVDALIQAQPNYPYFWELKGEMLIRAGRPGEAIQPLRQAVSMRPDAPLIRGTLGHALVASGDDRLLSEAISELSRATQADPDNAMGFRHLAMAYGRAGRIPEAELASAQGMLASGDHDGAKRFAQRAKQGLPTGSPGWLQADDILKYKPPKS